ncbi:MAG TPA: ribonuclease R [Dongiaceae bacterium]|nr:ribonuclease R [Dongiaceae bacterium]
MRISGVDDDGAFIAEPTKWPEGQDVPIISVTPSARTHALQIGDRMLAHIDALENESFVARPIRILENRVGRVVGLLEKDGRLLPADRKIKTVFMVAPKERRGAQPGEIVLAETEARHARVVERIGKFGEARTISLMSAAAHGLPLAFPSAVTAAADSAKAAALGERVDLRQVPLVTIDDEDARDFDDAVFAEPHEQGWRLIVAIADVAHYVRPHDALDREAQRRGNSVYFPDRVIPMLPEALSNGWCSLKPGEDRPCLAVEMFINRSGKKIRHRFMRGMMRSAARLTYRTVEAHRSNRVPGGHLENIDHLYGAFGALIKARHKRGTLDLDLPERRVFFGADGHISRITLRERLDSHRLIEEFMILANVCAAETLEAHHAPCLYRVHDRPDEAKIALLREFLAGLGFHLPAGRHIRPANFSELLKKVAHGPYVGMVNQLILRSQSQAVYSPENIGHFGLALARYAHFTSPIRRYADLLVHRSLIDALSLGRDGLAGNENFQKLGEHISGTERRAATAEREALDRFVCAFMAERIDQTFPARVSGVTPFGLFVALEENGADGLIPIASLTDDFYMLDRTGHILKGRRHGQEFRLGDKVTALLRAADPLTGQLNFQLVGKPVGKPPLSRGKPSRSRPREKRPRRR